MPVRYAGVILFLRLPSILFFTETVVSPCKIDLQLKIKVDQLETKVKEQDSFLTFLLLREKNERMATGSQSAPISNNQSAVAINGQNKMAE